MNVRNVSCFKVRKLKWNKALFPQSNSSIIVEVSER